MMNILEITDAVKDMSDNQLLREAMNPSGNIPQFVIVAEKQNRNRVRKEFAQKDPQEGTVAERIMAEGSGIMGAMPPQMAMAPQMPQRMPQMPPPQMPPQGIQQAMPPQMMSGGGLIRMQEGGESKGGLNLVPLRENLGGLGDMIKNIESNNRQRDRLGEVLRSSKGAVGLMQVMPATAAQPGYGVPSIFDLAKRAGIEVNEDQVTFDRETLDNGKIKITPTPEAIAEADRLLENPRLNEAMGLRYLEAMVDEFDGDLDRIGIAYNAGPKVAERWDGDPESLNPQTRNYISKLKSNLDVVNARDNFMGLDQQDAPEAGSLEAQAKVVEAIQRNRAAPPPRSAEEQLLDMAGGRPMPVVGQRAPRESVSVMPLPSPPAVSLDSTFDPTMAAPNISMPSLPPANRSGVATLPVDLGIGPDGPVSYPFGAPAPDKSGVTALPVDLGIGPDGPVRYPFGRPAESGVATLPTDPAIADARSAYMGRTGMSPTGDARMQATNSAEVQSRPVGRNPFFDQALVPVTEDQLRRREATGQFFTELDKSMAERRRFDAPMSGPTGRNPYVPPTETPVEKSIQEMNAELNIGPDGPVTSPFGTGGSKAGRFGGVTPPADANGTTPETKITDILVNLPSLDRSNPASMDITSPDYDLAGVIKRNQGAYDPFKFDLTKGETEPKPTPDATSPEFDITDILDESRRMNQANILMQLGAGIAAGDVSKGLSAAGAAAAGGAKEIRDLDMRSRLAKFQAGREDQKRETAASQFDRQMTLLEEKVKNAAEYGGAARDAAFIRVVGDDLERARDTLKTISPEKYPVEYRKAEARIKTLEETLYGVAGIRMPTVDTGGTGGVGGAGIVDYRDIAGSQAIVGG